MVTLKQLFYNLGLDLEKIIRFLKVECKAPRGFAAQEVGEEGVTPTTATILYVLSKLGQLEGEKRQGYIEELMSFQIKKGYRRYSFCEIEGSSVWATSWAIIAYCQLSNTYHKDMERAVLWLCKNTHSLGGWTYYGGNKGIVRHIYSFYALKALIEAKKIFTRIIPDIDNAIMKGLTYVRQNTTTEIPEMLMQANTVYKFTPYYPSDTKSLCMNLTMRLLRSLNSTFYREIKNFSITETSQPLFYINFYSPCIYLILRNIGVKPNNVIIHKLVRWLLETIIEEKGWNAQLDNRGKPHSWATALSLWSLTLFLKDCHTAGFEIKVPEEKDIIRKWGSRMIFKCFKNLERCPLYDNLGEASDYVFVIMPLSEEFNDIYELGIKPAVESLNLLCKRADKILHIKDIMCQICQNIQRARFVVADLTGLNPNVFYELGLSHGIEKQVILLTQNRDHVPFDLRSLNTIEYKQIIQLKRALSSLLGNLLKS